MPAVESGFRAYLFAVELAERDPDCARAKSIRDDAPEIMESAHLEADDVQGAIDVLEDRPRVEPTHALVIRQRIGEIRGR